jgi:Spy/CpxP family protein refolding chaperone
MLTKTKIAGLAVTLMALSAPMVYADNGGGDKDSTHQDGDWHHGQKDNMTAQILNLSEDQQKQLKDSRQKRKDAMKSIFEQMKTNREAFESEIVKATPDMNKINDIQTQIKALQSQMVDNHLNSILEIKKIMTPEQFAGWMALEKEEDMMKHEGHGHKHWGDKQEEGDRD